MKHKKLPKKFKPYKLSSSPTTFDWAEYDRSRIGRLEYILERVLNTPDVRPGDDLWEQAFQVLNEDHR